MAALLEGFRVIHTVGNGDYLSGEIRNRLLELNPENYSGMVFTGEIDGERIRCHARAFARSKWKNWPVLRSTGLCCTGIRTAAKMRSSGGRVSSTRAHWAGCIRRNVRLHIIDLAEGRVMFVTVALMNRSWDHLASG
jgi:hypothetical protein